MLLSTHLIAMRPIRNVDQVGRGHLMENYSLEDIKQLWNDWEIQSLILVSFGLQVFLFLAADVRRHSVSLIPSSLLWLAYMTADAVAVFALGHLAVAASAPGHELLLFWAPFVLLHLGGQDTITAFAMQDNELWRRHLLVLLTQATVAGYVVSRSSWPDRRLLAATVLMFLCGLFKYAERTWCLFSARPEGLKKSSFDSLKNYLKMAGDGRTVVSLKGDTAEGELNMRIEKMLDARRRLPPALAADTTLVSDALANDLNNIAGADALPQLLQDLKSNSDRIGAYRYVGALLSSCYDSLYTKEGLRGFWIEGLKESFEYIRTTQDKLWFLLFVLVLVFPLVSMSATLVLFMFTNKYQLYSRVDVIVSYILLMGAIILEVASLAMSILSHSGYGVAKCFYHLPGRTKQWSQLLAQYNMMEAYSIEARARMSPVPKWIHKLSGKLLGGKKVTHIKITEDLMMLVLDQLLEFGSDKKDWSFASTRGQLALQKQMEEIVSSSSTAMQESIRSVDFQTSVLIWHIATDICYFRLDNHQSDGSDPMKKQMARELSNYIMYLIFQCRVMLTSTSKLVHNTTMEGMEEALRNKVLPSNEAIKMVHDQIKTARNTIKVEEVEDEPSLPEDSGFAHEANQACQPTNSASSCDDQPVTQLQLLQNSIKALHSLVLPYACEVAEELDHIPAGRLWISFLQYGWRCFTTSHLVVVVISIVSISALAGSLSRMYWSSCISLGLFYHHQVLSFLH